MEDQQCSFFLFYQCVEYYYDTPSSGIPASIGPVNKMVPHLILYSLKVRNTMRRKIELIQLNCRPNLPNPQQIPVCKLKLLHLEELICREFVIRTEGTSTGPSITPYSEVIRK